MDNFYFSRSLDNDRTLFIAPLSDIDIHAAGETVEDASGYFLYQRSYGSDENPITVLARIHSEEAAFAMRELLDLS